MPAIGGSIREITLAGTRFPVTADADSNRKLGGEENEVQMNGDGTARLIKTKIPAMLDGVVISIDDSRGDQERLNELQKRTDFFPVSIKYASGVVYAGTMQITGEVTYSSQNTTATLSLMGPGELTKQA